MYHFAFVVVLDTSRSNDVEIRLGSSFDELVMTSVKIAKTANREAGRFANLCERKVYSKSSTRWVPKLEFPLPDSRVMTSSVTT